MAINISWNNQGDTTDEGYFVNRSVVSSWPRRTTTIRVIIRGSTATSLLVHARLARLWTVLGLHLSSLLIWLWASAIYKWDLFQNPMVKKKATLQNCKSVRYRTGRPYLDCNLWLPWGKQKNYLHWRHLHVLTMYKIDVMALHSLQSNTAIENGPGIENFPPESLIYGGIPSQPNFSSSTGHDHFLLKPWQM